MDFIFHFIVTWGLHVFGGLDFVKMLVVQVLADVLSIKWLGRLKRVGELLHLFWLWPIFSIYSLDVGVAMMIHVAMDTLSHSKTKRYFYPIETEGLKFIQKLSFLYWFGDPNYKDGVEGGKR
jgi:hypothetical protein